MWSASQLVKGLAAAALVVTGNACADTSKGYLEKQVGSQTVRLPLLKEFLPACEENAEFAERTKKVTPASHAFVTCAVDAVKWRAIMQGIAQPDTSPMFIVTVMRHKQGGALTRDEFAQVEKSARAQFPNTLPVDKETSAKKPRTAVTEKGEVQAAKDYELQMKGFFATQSKLPSFSFLTNRSYAVPDGNKTVEYREVTAISVVYYHGEVLQMMVLDAAGANGNTSRVRGVSQAWLDALNSLNE